MRYWGHVPPVMATVKGLLRIRGERGNCYDFLYLRVRLGMSVEADVVAASLCGCPALLGADGRACCAPARTRPVSA
jgi:hypothetical protein